MRVVVQRVSRASVSVDGEVCGRIGRGLMLLVGVAEGDTESSAHWLAGKCADLRIFEDDTGKMNLSARELGTGLLVVSQFTLLADCARGRRPSFAQAAPPDVAERLYRVFIDELRRMNLDVEEGVFQAKMLVEIHNDGPVTVILEKA
ncbi:MAG: D-tyrosyl-tRNA(Tyr) deacylase [Candidatus Eisenbacteria sp.]|nr:D-tyrosyl-tRNA(Tyr) deacylase [Candidatus Eisenbacteria bacterium]